MATPEKVLITGGREVGGLTAFAAGLSEGFMALGIPSDIVSPGRLFRRLRDLRDPSVLKILSTTGAFAALFGRRVICVAHGFPRADTQGWVKLLAIIASLKLINRCSGARLVAVSHYTAIHLRSIFNLNVDAVIHNPLKPLFLETFDDSVHMRNYVTYVGRLHSAKNLHRLMPVIRDLLTETPGLRACFIGDGELRASLQNAVNGDPGFEFKGWLDSAGVRDWLRRTRVFFSACETEALGISYLEALSQGCAVVMPACGGGLEIALDQIGTRVYLLPLSFNREEVTAVLRRALSSTQTQVSMAAYQAKAVAEAYLSVDEGFSCGGKTKHAFGNLQERVTGAGS
jgi:glycosyltransferase involved in cell wall biosynthesis